MMGPPTDMRLLSAKRGGPREARLFIDDMLNGPNVFLRD
jgi:hypothetical protein